MLGHVGKVASCSNSLRWFCILLLKIVFFRHCYVKNFRDKMFDVIFLKKGVRSLSVNIFLLGLTSQWCLNSVVAALLSRVGIIFFWWICSHEKAMSCSNYHIGWVNKSILSLNSNKLFLKRNIISIICLK